ncbi:MAG: enoyl-CoA hydratase/isomerase family protein [Bdellovibrionales bacterium]|nr:enoyl-CoA hydratase/isomerase family protein [Bdellovibrionales bacterium]
MSLVLFETDAHGIATITLNDPDRLNAMGEEMAQEVSSLVDSLKSQSAKFRAIILTGAGRAFSAGGNLEMLEKKRELSPEENKRRMLEFYNSFLCLRDLSVPLIAAINGHAIGAGLCVACACDIRVCSQNAKLGFTFTRLGLHPGMGATWFLPQVIGHAAAMELMLTARIVEGEDVLRLGLASQLLPAEEVVSVANGIAREICSCGPEATRQLLETLRCGSATMTAALEREAHCQAINYASDEFAEGVRAGIEKRKASFSAC